MRAVAARELRAASSTKPVFKKSLRSISGYDSACSVGVKAPHSANSSLAKAFLDRMRALTLYSPVRLGGLLF